MNEVITQVLEIQNRETEELAQRIVESAVRFKNTHDFQHFIDILKMMNKTLLTNGVFLRELLDTLEDIGQLEV